MARKPPQRVTDAVEAGVVQVTRRAEIYEYDGVTLWQRNGVDFSSPRLIDGNVSLDMNRDERRVLEGLTLENLDDALRPNPYDGLWYDKVVKVYRGVTYGVTKEPPRIAIIEAISETTAYAFRTVLTQMGFHRTEILLNASTTGDVADFDIIVSNREYSSTAKATLLKQLYEGGKSIFSIGNDTTSSQNPLIASNTASGSVLWRIQPPTFDSILSGWNAETYVTDTGQLITNPASNASVVAYMDVASTLYPAALIAQNTNGGKWFHYQPHQYSTEAKILFANALDWMHSFQPTHTWEVQLGEFVIDKIDEENFPYNIVIEGRDYTKRCMTSKFEQSVSFPAGTPIVQIVKALAANSGITKFNLPSTAGTLASQLDIERGTERWSVMKEISEANGWEIFFDNLGRLTMRQFVDPTLDPIFMTYKTGPDGNLVSYKKSTNDSNLFNHIIVVGENETQDGGEVGLPFFGEAKNVDPSSPTNVDRIGDRVYEYTSTYFTSDAQCENLAEKWLKIYALETYEISWDSICYPWQDVGSVVEVLMERRHDLDPTRFLLDTLTIPLNLGPMSATGKRVIAVKNGV